MNIVEAASLTGIILCMVFLLWMLIGRIAAQIRLRNLAGMILIDFIDMETEDDRNRVADRMREALAADRRKTVVHGWTRLGILEMTRKRT